VIGQRQLASPGQAFAKASILVGTLFLLLWILSWFPDLMLAFIISGLAAFVVSPIVAFLESRMGLRRIPAIVATFLVTNGILAVVVFKAAPILIARFQEIEARFKTFPLDEKLMEITREFESTLPFIDSAALARSIQAMIGGVLDVASSSVQTLLGTAMTLAIVPFVMYFILTDGRKAYTSLIERIPNRYFEMTLNVLSKIQRQLVKYLKGWILDSIIVGILTTIGLSILGINHVLAIGITAGVANLVPYLGTIVAATLAILVSMTQTGNFGMVGPILLMTIIIRLLDDFIVQPMCFARSINMHPLSVLLLLIIGHEMLGIGGMLLAIPVSTIIKVSAVETYWGFKNYRITA